MGNEDSDNFIQSVVRLVSFCLSRRSFSEDGLVANIYVHC